MATYKMAAVKVTPPNDFPLGLIRSHVVVIYLFLMLCDLQRVVRDLCPTLYFEQLMFLYISYCMSNMWQSSSHEVTVMQLIKLSIDFHVGLRPVTVFSSPPQDPSSASSIVPTGSFLCQFNSPPQDPSSASSISSISQTFTLISKQNFSSCISDSSAKCMLLLLLDSSPLSLLPFRAQWLLYIHNSVQFCYTGCLVVPYVFHNKQPLFPCTALTVWSL